MLAGALTTLAIAGVSLANDRPRGLAVAAGVALLCFAAWGFLSLGSIVARYVVLRVDQD